MARGRFLATFAVTALAYACSQYGTGDEGPKIPVPIDASDANDAPADAGDAGSDAASDADASYSSVVLADLPVLYLRLGETSGVDAIDQIGAHNGRYGGNAVLGVNGLITNDPDRAVAFDGGKGHVAVAPITGLLSGFAPYTIEAWIVVMQKVSSSVWILGREDVVPPRYGVSFIVDSAGVAVERWVNGDARRIDGPNAPLPGKVTHVATTFDGTRLQVWVDAVPGTTQAIQVDASVPESTQPIVIGSQSGQLAGFFAGVIDEVAIYDHVLTPARIAAHYNAGH